MTETFAAGGGRASVIEGAMCHIRKENITIVLHRPKHAMNIGFAVRCAMNMGIDHVVVVRRAGDYDQETIQKTATHGGATRVAGIRYVDDLEPALAHFQYVVGSTARLGNTNLKRETVYPRDMAEKLVDIAHSNTVGLLFGPEDRGLTNDELRCCDMLVTIPVSSEMKSINLSHAVMILCYEICCAAHGRGTTFTPRLATYREREEMFAHLQDMLIKINFINPENPEYWMTAIRRFFSRGGLRSKDVKIIRGICRQIALFGRGETKDRASIMSSVCEGKEHTP
jgi:tRNA/rRNA methyltransferase